MDLNLSGRTAIVAASSQGLGRAIAEELVKEGANVVITSRSEEKLKEVCGKLKDLQQGKVSYIVGDLTNGADIQRIIRETIDTYGGIDILVNNAGGPPAGAFEDITDEEWQTTFELNLLSYIRLIRAALPHLKKKGGRIVNIASSSVKEPIPGLILSNTFRTAITGLSKTLAAELAPHHILINTLAPGRIATDRVRHLDEINADKAGLAVEEIEDRMKGQIPLGRYGEPAEFARVAAFLLSDANSYMTGSTFLVDGGMVKSL
ncbi:SDR family oxidoreductase [Peribacillus sp. SCS-37]|uniref:SDR family oxidoreductase n=1 Tax=Paraperibacillus esterisolvens TaxID=3115296 RepID=UPI003906BAAF